MDIVAKHSRSIESEFILQAKKVWFDVGTPNQPEVHVRRILQLLEVSSRHVSTHRCEGLPDEMHYQVKHDRASLVPRLTDFFRLSEKVCKPGNEAMTVLHLKFLLCFDSLQNNFFTDFSHDF